MRKWRYSSTHSLTSELDEVSGQLHTPHPQGKSPWYPLDRRLGGPQSRSESGGEGKNSQLPTTFKTIGNHRVHEN